MKKAVGYGFAEAFWQDMKHQQIKKVFSGDGSGLILFGFGIDVSEDARTIFASSDIFFLNDASVQILTQVNVF